MDFAAVILAAGKSTRMKSSMPKAAHPVCGKAVTRHVVDACFEAGVSQVVVVVGHQAETVKQVIGDDVAYVLQEEQLGTGHAAMQAMPMVDRGAVLVLPGDAPLITGDTLQKLMRYHEETEAAATLLTAIMDDPCSYGRVVRGSSGNVERITEARDATPEVLAINETAMSIYCFDTALLKQSLSELRADNVQKEYYLTDTVSILRGKGYAVKALPSEDPRETLGINTRIELAEASAIMRRRILDGHMLAGVTVVDPNTTYVDVDVQIGRDTVINPCTSIEGRAVIGENCIIGPLSRLSDCRVENYARIGPFEQLEAKGSTD
jgi:bifunctional UDP-N-acetylglucosamine pyrophosphorylase / glucosamine-1-phosphate N-acetyltransferase